MNKSGRTRNTNGGEEKCTQAFDEETREKEFTWKTQAFKE
jgi:hypothetical protein